ncbi:GntR family transcriptional regulator [Aliiruegeria sabulilitoris]|uniref:GntR family transcriptional regulator n=1 Tax=Aliiruegeria sabulilitoris TaxID=1510458 RepID=UPI00082CD4BA|nr:GntR family transcriptional regulator [Aliiruegeria sabulilitoris]NDR59295.1 GntR family transcriptional regulator [Pseudoruegeria sp. M32A2M]
MKNGIQKSSSDATSQEVSATHKAYLALRRMIVVGELQPGEKLKIDRLRSILDTGASPVREALSLLTSDLLVERLDQRGFRAAETSHENFVEILTLRCELEEMALRQSIANADETWEDALVLAHHKMVRQDRADLEAFEARHKDFHMALLDNCRSPILMKFCSQLYDLNIRYRYLAGKALDYQKRDVSAEHEAILEAALDRDPDLASERLLSHYRQTGAFLNGLFSREEGEP